MTLDRLGRSWTFTGALKEDGFALVAGVAPSDLLPIAQNLGHPAPDTNDPAVVRDLHPQAASSAAPNTLSGRHGTGAFPFHTETAYWQRPARYVLLYCVNPGAGKRPTLVADVLGKLSPSNIQTLSSELWVVGRRRHPFLASLIENATSGLRLRFDTECMRPVDRSALGPTIMARLLERRAPAIVEWKAGDLLILDNFRVVHGRGASAKPDGDRHLRRVLVAEE